MKPCLCIFIDQIVKSTTGKMHAEFDQLKASYDKDEVQAGRNKELDVNLFLQNQDFLNTLLF